MTERSLTKRLRRKSIGSNDKQRILVLGGGHVGHAVAKSLATQRNLTFVDESEAVCRRAEDIGSTYCGDPASAEVLSKAGADQADIGVVTTERDTQTFLATQLLRTRFDVEFVVARADDPDVADVIGDQTDAVISAPPILAPELVTAVERVSQSKMRR